MTFLYIYVKIKKKREMSQIFHKLVEKVSNADVLMIP